MLKKNNNLVVVGTLILICNVNLLSGEVELENLRTPSSKTYLLENGSFRTEIFPYEIYYMDEHGGYQAREDTNVAYIYTGSPNRFNLDGSTFYGDDLNMRVGRSDVTKNNSLYFTLTGSSIYTNVKYRAYSTWDISGVGDENLIDNWGIKINSIFYASTLNFHFQNNTWTQTVYMKYGDIIPFSSSNAQLNYTTIGSAPTIISKNLTGDLNGDWSSESFNYTSNGYSNLDQYVKDQRINGEDELDILFKGSNESSGFTFNSDTSIYWDYSIEINDPSLIITWDYENPTVFIANYYNYNNLYSTSLYFENITSQEGIISIPSGTNVAVNDGDYCFVKTRTQFVNWFGNKLQHHHWNPLSGQEIMEYRLSHTFISDFNSKFNDIAEFEKVEEIIISTSFPVQVQIQDPWYVREDGAQTGTDWVDIEGGSYLVFLDQGGSDTSNLIPPFYTVRAPRIIAMQDSIYVLSGWDTTNATVSEDLNHPGDLSYRAVVFLSQGATVEAVYTSVNGIPNYTLTIEADDSLTIPAGANIYFATGFTIETSLMSSIIINGTEEQPILLFGANGNWGGIKSGSNDIQSIVELNHVHMVNAPVAIDLNSPKKVTINHSTLNGRVILNEPENWLDGEGISITHTVFENIPDVALKISQLKCPLNISETKFANVGTAVKLDGVQDTVRIDGVNIQANEKGIHVVGSVIEDDHIIKIENSLISGIENGYGILYENITDLEFHNNNRIYVNHVTITDNKYGIDLQFANGNPNQHFRDLQIVNSIIWNNEEWDFDNTDLDNIAITYSDFGITSSDSGNINTDPIFVNPEEGNYSLQWNSPCIDAGNPNSPLDPDGTIADIGAFPFLHYSGEVTGELADGSVILGEVLLSGDVWVPANASLTIAPNTNISFEQNASLDIQGTLTSDGTDGSISFDLNGSNILVSGEAEFVNTSFTGGTLKYEGDQSSGTVYSSSFTNATLVINEGAFATVRNTSFSGGDVGLMTSGISTSPEISNCTFSDLDIAIRANYHSSPVIRYSTIANSGVGLDAIYSSSPNLTNGITAMRSCNTTNNVIKNCDVAVHTWHMSSPNLGHGPYRLRPWLDVSYDLLGYNSIYGNEVNFHNQGSTIYAIGNNWSLQSCSFTGPFGFDEASVENVLWEPVLAELVPSPEIANIEELYHKASKLEAAGDFEAALDLYAQVVTAVPNEKPGELSLYGLARCYKALNQEEAMILALVSISEQFEGTGVHKHAHSLLSSHKIKDGELAMLLEAEGHIHTIRTEYPNNEMEPKLLYEEFLIAKKRGDGPLGRTTAGSHVHLSTKEVYRKLKENYPDSPFTFLAGLESANSKKIKTTPAVPTSFTLYPAYPNPFNPTTTIRFDIETSANINLTVYDIYGREVTQLVQEVKTSGRHKVIWDGRDKTGREVATGMYICKLTSKSLKTGRMFTQSNKMILLK